MSARDTIYFLDAQKEKIRSQKDKRLYPYLPYFRRRKHHEMGKNRAKPPNAALLARILGAMSKPKYCGPEFRCVVTGQPGADLHHIYTRKARPDLADEKWNQLPVHHFLHQDIHQRGLVIVSAEFPLIALWLQNYGWEFCEYKGKWTHPLAATKRN